MEISKDKYNIGEHVKIRSRSLGNSGTCGTGSSLGNSGKHGISLSVSGKLYRIINEFGYVYRLYCIDNKPSDICEFDCRINFLFKDKKCFKMDRLDKLIKINKNISG